MTFRGEPCSLTHWTATDKAAGLLMGRTLTLTLPATKVSGQRRDVPLEEEGREAGVPSTPRPERESAVKGLL